MGDYSDYRQRSGGERGPDGIANKIIAMRTYPGNELLSFLLVEGDTDRKFYTIFVDENKCHVNSAFNKSTALQVLSILEERAFPGVLVIVDADFDVLEGKPLLNGNVLYTDTHDLETMLMRSPALEKVLGEFGSSEKIEQLTKNTGKDVRTLLLECGISLGYLRWISLRENLSLVFEDLNFEKFMHRDTLSVDQASLIQVVKNKSQKPGISEIQIKRSIQSIQIADHDPWHVCCGHDLVCILARGLHGVISRGKNNTRNASPDILEISLRLAFERAYFHKTTLYASIKQWETINAPYAILVLE